MLPRTLDRPQQQRLLPAVADATVLQRESGDLYQHDNQTEDRDQPVVPPPQRGELLPQLRLGRSAKSTETTRAGPELSQSLAVDLGTPRSIVSAMSPVSWTSCCSRWSYLVASAVERS